MKAKQALEAAREMQLVADISTDLMFHGLSMDPLLFEGDIVIIEPVKYNEIEVGDIITYRHLDRYPTRRVVAVHSDRLVLWCDAWPERIFSATPDDVLGRAVARVRNGHRLAATDPEWTVRSERALRLYRRTRPKREVRRVASGIRRRLKTSSPRPSSTDQT